MRIALSKRKFIEKPGRDFDWAAFNDGFINGETDALGFINAVYNGRAFCPQMNGRRSIENFICAQHLAIDLDTGDYRSTFDALAEHPLVRQYGAILYETPSHTDAAPRSRVVFILDKPIESAEGYRLALRTVTGMFDGADESCVDPARFFFGNGRLAQERRTEGIWFTDPAVFPLADLRMYARQALVREKEQNLYKQRQLSTAGMENKHQEWGEKPDLHKVAEMLGAVDAYGLDYKTWMKVIAALRYEYGDAAYPLARDWSEAPGKEPLTERKWSSFRNHNNPATIATIIHVAREYGR